MKAIKKTIKGGKMNNRMTGKMKKMASALMLAAVMVMGMQVSAFAETVTQDDALTIALADAQLDREEIDWLEVELDDGGRTIEIEFVQKSSNMEYEYEISTADGAILEKSVEYDYD